MSLMETLERQNRLVDEVSRLVTSVNRLSEAVDSLSEANGCDDDLAPEPIEHSEAQARLTTQEVRLGYEIDQCSGSLTVQDRQGQYVSVPRGQWTTVDVAINGDGYWRWRCGSSNERSRGAPNFRQRVKRLKVWHSLNNRKITWWCFDLLP
jgi:hypothetical protein